ncbi:MAG: NTP transferase domain-containing protein [Candidatus Omnitrophica bacterium]|nr:NTP transferase domain-containing protein [Candidatus Omnitrophota bacterium]
MKSPFTVKTPRTFCAWILIQALLLSQIFTPFANAHPDTLRVQQEGGQAGLEEALVTRPAKGFATKVRRVTEAGLQVAKREVGRLVGRAELDLEVWSVTPLEPEAGAASGDIASAQQVLKWAREGIAWLRQHERSIPLIRQVQKDLEALGVSELPVEFRANHAMTLDFNDEEPAVRLDTTVASELADKAYNTGRKLLYAIGMFQEMALAAGFSQRETIHLALAVYEKMTDKEREELHKILQSPHVDHGDTWGLFLKDAGEEKNLEPELKEFRGVDSLALKEGVDHDLRMTDEARERARRVIRHRDKKVSWLMGQLLVDLPYNRAAFRKAMEIQNVPARRAAAYKVIGDFDPKVEEGNAERLSQAIREEWLPEDLPYPVLLAGRESRAFGNQALLAANSEYLPKTEELVKAAQTLLEAAKGEALLKELAQAAEEAPPLAKGDLKKAISAVKDLLAHLGPASGRLRQLILDKEPVVPRVQINGALHQMRDVVSRVFQGQAGRAVQQALDRARARPKEGPSRRLRGEGVAVGRSFEKAARALDAFAGVGGHVAQAANSLEDAADQAHSYAAAYSVLLQRPSLTGAERFRANELEEKPEQEEALRDLVGQGGHNLYMSPSNAWVGEATDVIEAAPLFIYERTIEVEGKTVTVFEVDQEGLEQTVRQMANDWAVNIDKTIDSEHLALAREIVVRNNPGLLAAARFLMEQGLPEEAAFRRVLKLQKSPEERAGLLVNVAQAAAWAGQQYDQKAREVEDLVERGWRSHRFITRIQALRELLLRPEEAKMDLGARCGECLKLAGQASAGLRGEVERLTPMALARQRPMPAFHLLTTEAPGLSEGFIQVVLEEEMALRNVVRAYQLEPEVKRRMDSYAQRVRALGRKVIQEFGYESKVEQYRLRDKKRSEDKAVEGVVADHLPIQQEVARLAVLIEAAEAAAKAQGQTFQFNPEKPDPAWVEEILQRTGKAAQGAAREALDYVWERNRLDPELAGRVKKLKTEGKQDEEAIEQAIRESEIYSQELAATMRQAARRQALEELAAQPDYQALKLKERVKRWYRDHTALSRTTARRETVAANRRSADMNDPRFAYGAGTIAETPDGKLRPIGRGKRYHLIYANSRVNLGKGELDSVLVLPQWVGANDPLAAEHGRRFYSLINYEPTVRTIKEVENLKVSENQWTALVRAVRNVQAYFVNRLGMGDTEDLAYQFNLRGGIPMAAIKEPESYSAGPTAGYCIPKDPLFKLFITTFQDRTKLSKAGIPEHLHEGIMALMTDVALKREEFGAAGEWERWAVEHLLADESYKPFFEGEPASQAARIFKEYFDITGGGIVFHLTKLTQVLGTTGVPSPLLSNSQDLHAVVWSNWAEQMMTLGGEQVNRSVVFSMTREIPEAVREAQRLNPQARVPAPEQARVHLYGPYKADENYPSPPDVRYSWTMRAFMILSGFWKEVALSLDEEGQILARLSWPGFEPDSDDPEAVKATRYVGKHFMGTDDLLRIRERLRGPEGQALLAKLEEQFPRHTTVGHVTMTVVPGVSADDLLGFSSETPTLLGDEAARVRELLQARGISPAQMGANAESRREFPSEWVPHLQGLSEAEKKVLQQEVGGGIHVLNLLQTGPGTNFSEDIQGQDAVVFSGPHPEIMRMDPVHLRDHMLQGHPHSALAALDFVAQGRHRVWFDRDIMLWYAAGRGIDTDGNRITRWEEREAKGRKAVYRAFGFGRQEYRPLLGTDLREEVAQQESRAAALFRAMERVAAAPEDELAEAVAAFRAQYGEWIEPTQMKKEAALAREYDQHLLLNRRSKPRDAIIREALVDMAVGLDPQKFGQVHWLAAGGFFLLNGEPEEEQAKVLDVIRQAQERMKALAQAAGLEEIAPRVRQLIVPRLALEAIRLAERKGEMFSVKASEARAVQAIARRKALTLEAARLALLSAREEGFQSVQSSASPAEAAGALAMGRGKIQEIMEELQSSGPEARKIHQAAGVVMGLAVKTLVKSARELLPEEKEEEKLAKEKLIQAILEFSKGRELNLRSWKSLVGTYEEHGLLARLFELAKPKGQAAMERVTAAAELATMSLALEKTAPFLAAKADELDEGHLWRALAEFFAETIDDHFYEYNPWIFDPKRGGAFTDYYDELGVLKPERREKLYRLSWEHHRALYPLLRALILQKTRLRHEAAEDAMALLGDVELGGNLKRDRLTVQAIGAGAPGRFEALWRGYNQLREMAFIVNDGFEVPVVLQGLNPSDPLIFDAQRRVGHVFLSGVGRTHYSRAPMEASTLGENIFITRDGQLAPLKKTGELVLQIQDGHGWLSEAQYRQALIQARGMTPQQANEQIAKDRATNRLTPKGIRAAVRFSSPMTVGSVVTIHHHYLEGDLSKAGYPLTDKRHQVLFDITYDKTLYPGIFNPESETGVLLPPEIDWHRKETEALSEAEAKAAIVKRLKPFAEKHPSIIAKGSAESGARNLKRFDFRAEGPLTERDLEEAASFIYDVSKGQNVTVQRAIVTTPLAWMDPQAVEEFVERQIVDWGVAVSLDRHPKSWVYGTLRVILSGGPPKDLSRLEEPSNWQASHLISLNSLQVATNVGRQGTLEELRDEMVRKEFRETFIPQLTEAGQKTMAVLARYGKKYWDEVFAPAYLKQFGEAPRELDAAGVPYWWPNYLMLDFLPEPVWGRGGKEIQGARVVDVIPGDPKRGTSARFILEDAQGKKFEGEILRFRMWLLEPNVGIGLWPNLWKRQLFYEKEAAKREARPMDWSRVGKDERVVLENYLAFGEAILRNKGYFGPEGPVRGPAVSPFDPGAPAAAAAQLAPAEDGASQDENRQVIEEAVSHLNQAFPGDITSPETALSSVLIWLGNQEQIQRFPTLQDEVYRTRVAELALDRRLSEPLAPPVVPLPEPPSPEELKRLLPHGKILAVVTGKTALMNHHLYPWHVGAQGQPVSVVGVHASWLTADGRANRLIAWDSKKGRFVEFACPEPVRLTHAFVVELPASTEIEQHRQLSKRLSNAGVQMVNPAEVSFERADDKRWLRENHSADVLTPESVLIPSRDKMDVGKLREVADKSPQGIIIQPAFGTTEGEGVEWFAQDDRTGQMAHILKLTEAGQNVLVSQFRGNVTYGGRPLVFRFNVASGEVTSATAVVGPEGSRIASLGQGGMVENLGKVFGNLTDSENRRIAIKEKGWRRLEEAALAAAKAAGLPIVGVDIVPETRPDGKLAGVVLEVNARPGILIFSEAVQFSEEGLPTSNSTSPVGPAFWGAVGISSPQSGLEEKEGTPLKEKVDLEAVQVLAPKGQLERLMQAPAVLITLDAGLGNRFTAAGGTVPKVLAPLGGVPLGMLPKLDVEEKLGWPIVSIVGHEADRVMAEYNRHSKSGIIFVKSENPKGGTGYAAYHAGAVSGLADSDKILVVTVGDRPLQDAALFQKALEAFQKEGADLLLGFYETEEPKGLVVERGGQVVGVLERSAFKAIKPGETPFGYSWEQLGAIRKTNASLYVIRAKKLFPLLAELRADKERGEYFLTDIVEAVAAAGGRVIAFEIPEENRQDVTTVADHVKLQEHLAANRPGSTTGLEEVESPRLPLGVWKAIIADPVASGLRAQLEELVRPHRINENLEQIRELVQEASRLSEEGFFDPNLPFALTQAPGRVRVFMGHSDLAGIGGQTINAAVHDRIWMFVQMTKDGKVRAKNLGLDTTGKPYRDLEFSMADPYALPPRGIEEIRTGKPGELSWLAWAEQHAIKDKWEGLIKGTLAFIRTKCFDRSERVGDHLEGKGFRLLVSKTNLPPRGGLSSSSALPSAFAHAIEALLPEELRFSARQHNDIDYANFVVGDRAGTADITAINTAQLGKVTVQFSFPEGVGETVELPENFRFFIAAPNLPRLDDENSQPPEVTNYAAYVKSLTGMGPSLAVLWLRHIARSQGHPMPYHGNWRLEDLLLALYKEEDKPWQEREAGRAAKVGQLRELTEHGSLREPEYADLVGEDPRKFIEKLLNQIPNDLTLGQILEVLGKDFWPPGDVHMPFYPSDFSSGFKPLGAHRIPGKKGEPEFDRALEELKRNSVIPLRQLAWYAVSEIARGLQYAQAARQGEAQRLLELMREAQNGDRAVWDPLETAKQGKLVLTEWGKASPKEAFFRSTPAYDAMIDEFEGKFKGPTGEPQAAGRIMGAGLGGAIAIGTMAPVYAEAVRHWKDKGCSVMEIEPSGGASAIGKELSGKKSGLEEGVRVLTEGDLDKEAEAQWFVFGAHADDIEFRHGGMIQELKEPRRAAAVRLGVLLASVTKSGVRDEDARKLLHLSPEEPVPASWKAGLREGEAQEGARELGLNPEVPGTVKFFYFDKGEGEQEDSLKALGPDAEKELLQFLVDKSAEHPKKPVNILLHDERDDPHQSHLIAYQMLLQVIRRFARQTGREVEVWVGALGPNDPSVTDILPVSEGRHGVKLQAIRRHTSQMMRQAARAQTGVPVENVPELTTNLTQVTEEERAKLHLETPFAERFKRFTVSPRDDLEEWGDTHLPTAQEQMNKGMERFGLQVEGFKSAVLRKPDQGKASSLEDPAWLPAISAALEVSVLQALRAVVHGSSEGIGYEALKEFTQAHPRQALGIVSLPGEQAVAVVPIPDSPEKLVLLQEGPPWRGYLYHARRRAAEGLSPVDPLPAALEKIAEESDDISPAIKRKFEKWLSWHHTVKPSALASIAAATGAYIDGNRLVVNASEADSATAFILATAAKNVTGGHLVQARQGSAETTTEKDWPYQGPIAVSSALMGMDRKLAGGWADWVKPVEFTPDSTGGGGQVVVHTLLLAPDGSVRVFQTTFRTSDLENTKKALANPSAAAGLSQRGTPVSGPPEGGPETSGLEEAAESEAAVDVIDGTTTLVLNRRPDVNESSPFLGDVASSVLGLANRVLPRPDDKQIAFVAVWNEAGMKEPAFQFDLSKPLENVAALARAKGIALGELKVGLDVNPSIVNTVWLPQELMKIGVKRENIIAFPQIQQAINVALNNDPASKLHERFPWFTQSFDLLIGTVGATEVAGWANAIAQIPGAEAAAVFLDGDAKAAEDFDSLWLMRLKDQVNVRGEAKEVFDLEDLADLDDPQKLYAFTVSTGYMNFPGIHYGPEGVEAYTVIFQEGEEPLVLVDSFAYARSRKDALERALDVSEGFREKYPTVYQALLRYGPEAAHPVKRNVVNLEETSIFGDADRSNWPDGFLGLELLFSRAYWLGGQGKNPPAFVRGNGHRDTLAAAVASGWLRGIAKTAGLDAKLAGKAADRLARDAMGARMDSEAHPKRIVAFEGARDGSDIWKFGDARGAKSSTGLEEPLQRAAEEFEQASRRLGFEMSPRWRGVDERGKISSHRPNSLTVEWFQDGLVDPEEAARILRSRLSEATDHPAANVLSGDRYLSVVIPPRKTWAMREEMVGQAGKKRLAIVVGDAAKGDFVTEEEMRVNPLPLPLVQVLVQGSDAPNPTGYPNVVLAQKGGQGVDQLWGELLGAVRDGLTYGQIALLAPQIPSPLRGVKVNAQDLLLFVDVDGTLMGSRDTFAKTQDGIEGQSFQGERLGGVVQLAGLGADFRITSGKAAEEVSAKRIRSDEERLMVPLGQALKEQGAKPKGVSYLFVFGTQNLEYALSWELVRRRVAPPAQPADFSDAEAAAILRLVASIVEDLLRVKWEEPLKQAEVEIQERGRELGVQFFPQWRGVDAEGHDTPHQPALLTFRWMPKEALDGDRALKQLEEKLPGAADRQDIHPYRGEKYLAAGIILKPWAIRSLLREQAEANGKKFALIVGDAALGDFVPQGEVDEQPFPIPFVQILVDGKEAAAPDDLPNLVQLDKGAAGMDELLGNLILGIQRGFRYEAILGPDASGFDPSIKDRAISPRELVIVTDVDGTILEEKDTLDSSQDGVEGQTARPERRDRIVQLARLGVHFHFLTGKSVQEITGTRVRSDNDRLLKPLMGRLQGSERAKIGFDGVSGIQQIRFTPDEKHLYRKAEFPGMGPPLSVPSAVQILHLMADILIDSLSPAGLEEIRLPAGATEGRLIVLTPETARAGITALALLKPAGGEGLRLAAVVSDETQEAEVAAGLEEAGLTLAVPAVNLEKTGWSLAEAIVDIQVRAWGQELTTFVLETIEQLAELGRFLQVSTLEKWLKQVEERLAAAVSA